MKNKPSKLIAAFLKTIPTLAFLCRALALIKRQSIVRAFAAASFLILSFQSVVSAQNLLANPDFETGDTSGWTRSGNLSSGTVTSPAYAGTYSAFIATSAATGMKPLYQNFNVYTGKRYEFNGYVYLDGATNQGCGIGVRSGGGALSALGGAGNAVSSTTVTGAWTYVYGSSIVPTGVTVYGFNMYLRTNGTLTPWSTGYFDNLYFAPAPAPPAITGFAASPGAAGGQVVLSWTSPVGSAGYSDALAVGSTFYVQYASWTGVNFSTDTKPPVGGYDISIPTGPVNQGTSVYYTVEGLTDGVTYYFRLWTRDAAGQWSAISALGATSYATVAFDFVPPDAISDLAALAITQDDSITLEWTSPGNDGSTGDLSGAYLIQYASQTTIGSVVWDYAAAQINISTSGVAPGTANQYKVAIVGGTTYYFRIWSRDVANNYSTISNGATMYLGLYPPAAITDLTAAVWNSTVGAVALQWTAPADPPSGGAAAGYIVRYATWNFTDGDFNNVNRARFALAPKSPGQTEFLVITGLPSDRTVYFRIKSSDTVGNLSGIDTSNPAASVAVPPHLLISQFAAGSISSTQEFVELYNPCNFDINLESMGLKLRIRTAGGTDTNKPITFTSSTIKSYGYFLIGTSTDATNGKRLDGTIASGITNDGSVYITLSASEDLSRAIDLVSYGSLTDTQILASESSIAPALATGNSLKRNVSAVDTNLHSADFILQSSTWTPKNSDDPAEPPPAEIPARPTWVAGEIVITTNTIKWALKNEHSATVEMFVATAQNIGARIAGAELGAILAAATTSWTEIELSSNTPYTRYGEAYLATGSSWTSALTMYTLAYPPSSASANSAAASAIDISWNFSGATKYIVTRSTNNFATAWSTAAAVDSPAVTYQDTGRDPNTTYYYRILAVNAQGATNYADLSPIVSTTTYPAPPSGFGKQSASATSIVWQWSAPSSGADGYRVYQATSPTTLVADVGPLTTYTEQNLSTNTAYGRFARAYNSRGESLASNHATFYTSAVPPSSLGITEVFQTSVTLVWANGGNPSQTRWGLARAEDIGFDVNHTTFAALADNLTALTTVAAGLGGNTTYYFRAWAYNGDGILTGYGDVVSTLTLPGTPASPVGLYGAAVSTTIIKWEWNITANATFYRIHNAVGDALLANLDGNGTTTWFENALSSNTLYTRYVKAGNVQGLSAASSNASRYTHAHPPSSLGAAAVSSSTINLSWPHSGAANYQVWVSTVGPGASPLSNPTTTAALAYAHQNLAAGVTHYYRIIPVNGNDLAYDAFNFPVASTRTWPSGVPTFTATAFTNNSITWQWTAAVGADFYTLHNAQTGALVQTPGALTSYEETGLGANVSAGRYVRAHNTSGSGVISPSATYYTLANPPASPSVTGVTAQSVSLSWGDGGNPGGTRFGIARSQDNFSSSVTIVNAASNLTSASYTDTGLAGETTYYYRIVAYNGDSKETAYTATVGTMTNSVPNLLTNGGFENGLTGWSPTPSTLPSLAYAASTDRAYSGAYSLWLSTGYGTSRNTGLYQNVAVTAGKTYQLSGYIWNNDSNDTGGTGLGLVPHGGGIYGVTLGVHNSTVTTANSTNWQYLSITTTVAGGVTSMGINAFVRVSGSLHTTSYFDNIIFNEIPDLAPPAAISNLTALSGPAEGQITLRWSAPSGDDGDTKTLSGGYIIKYSSVQIINSADFNAPAFVHGAVTISTSGVTVGQEVRHTLALTPGASYWFAIKSTDTAGNLSVWKSSADVPAINTAAYGWALDLPPAVVSVSTAIAVSSDSVKITWGASDAADFASYELESSSYSASAGFAVAYTTNVIVSTTYFHLNLVAGNTYYYKVRVKDARNNYSAYSSTMGAFPYDMPPAAPSLAGVAVSSVSIQWTVTDNAVNENGLYVTDSGGTRMSPNLGPLPSAGNTTSWTETNGAWIPDTLVTRKAEASGSAGSSYSGDVSARTAANSPAALAVDYVTRSTITLTWNANSNPGSTRYEVTYSTDDFSLHIATHRALADNYTATSATITSLSTGLNYKVRVRAFNSDAAPTGYVTVSTQTFTVGNVLANSFFDYWDSANKPTSWNYSGSATHLTQSVETLNPDGSRSVNWAPTTSANNLFQGSVPVTGSGTMYAEVWVKLLGGTQIRVSVNIHNPVTGAMQTTSNNIVTSVGEWVKLTRSSAGLSAGDFGGLTIRADRSGGSGTEQFLVGAAWLSDATPPANWPVPPPDTEPPAAISNLAASTPASPEGAVRLTWTSPGDNDTTGALDGGAYRIKYSQTDFSTFRSTDSYDLQFSTSGVNPGTSVGHIFTGLFPGTTYYFAVLARDAAGNWSVWNKGGGVNTNNWAPAMDLPPAAAAQPVAVSSNTSAAISWAASPEIDVVAYRVSSNTADNFGGATAAAVVSTPTLSVQMPASSMLNGVEYYFWVQAVDRSGKIGAQSPSSPVVPRIRPPSGLAAAHTGSVVNLSWTGSPDSAASNFAGYRIYRSSLTSTNPADFSLLASMSGGTTHQDTAGIESSRTYYYIMRSSDSAGPLSVQTSTAMAAPDQLAPEVFVWTPSTPTARVSVPEGLLAFLITVTDFGTPFISGIATDTVKLYYSTSAPVSFTEVPITQVGGDETAGLFAVFFQRSDLPVSATMQYFITAADKVGNYAPSTTYYVYLEGETTKSVSSASGGTVALADGNPFDGETSVVIPPGALTADAIITIKEFVRTDPAVKEALASRDKYINTAVLTRPAAVYEFGPSGTIFAKPATITLRYTETGGKVYASDAVTELSGVSEDTLRIFWWDGAKWVYVGGEINKDQNTVSAKVGHFSIYALFPASGAPEKPTASVKFITPNNDGINDVLQFEGTIKEITIYDINGRVVRKLDGYNYWDAKDESGKTVEIGAYIWRAVYPDGKSNYGTVVVAK